MKIKENSFWFDQLNVDIKTDTCLDADINTDVAIIGAGYTGLWTAYYLAQQRPELSIVILESETVGFGASGRNGGWLIGGISKDLELLSTLNGEDKKIGHKLLTSIIDEVEEVTQRENIDCDLHRGGTIQVAARYPEQLSSLKQHLSYYRSQGLTEQDYRWLSKQETIEKVNMHHTQGALYSPHCAAINPAKLVLGLAQAVRDKGVKIYQNSHITSIQNKYIKTEKGSVTSTIIVPATEGFSRNLLQLNRYLLPIQSLLIATEPLSKSMWDQIGLKDRPTFCDAGRLTTYGQRSTDGRLIFGARGGYQFGGKVQGEFNLNDPAFRMREELLRALFPALNNTAITHGWGGTIAMTRTFSPYVLFDPATGIASAGGYGGEGVGASNLFARTLVDLILNNQSERTSMPWVFSDHNYSQALKHWEREPARYLTYQLILKSFAWEDKLYSTLAAPNIAKVLTASFCNQLNKLIE